MKCFQCGTELPEGTRFCGHCGVMVSDPDAATIMVEPEESEVMLARMRRIFVGEYEVERELARGGMAIVYRATETALRRSIAPYRSASSSRAGIIPGWSAIARSNDFSASAGCCFSRRHRPRR